MADFEEILPDFPPPFGEPPLGLPPLDPIGGGILSSGPFPPGTRPRPRPPIEWPPDVLPPGERPPAEGSKSILKMIQDWFMNLPLWARIALFAVAIAILIAMLYKFLKGLYGSKPPPDLEPPDEDILQIIPIAIMFNYDATLPVALNIRRNATEEVSIPEWTLADTLAEESPAAYSMSASQGKVIRIKVRLIIIPAIDALAEVRAVGGGILGDATRSDPVTFVKGKTVPEFITFELENHTIGSDGVRRSDITWSWEFRRLGESGWHTIGETTHRIYEVLTTPDLPWSQTPFPDPQNPWTEVLDVSCVWAAGAKTPKKVASRVTRAVNGPAGGVRYDMQSGMCKYTSGYKTTPGVFNCTMYLDRLRKGAASDSPGIVNCSDCSAFVSTFANAVGASLSQSVMGLNFQLNPIIAIGHNSFGFPNWGPGFSYHEVAWWGQGGQDEQICDGCLRTNSNGSKSPGHAVLPINTGFYNPYRPQLVPPNDIQKCAPMPQHLKSREVI